MKGPNSPRRRRRARPSPANANGDRPAGPPRWRVRRSLILPLGVVALLVAAASALAFQNLPPGGQVNDDNAARNPQEHQRQRRGSQQLGRRRRCADRGQAGGPVGVFRQQETNGTPPPTDQVFSRSFAGGAGRPAARARSAGESSAHPSFLGSLNFDQAQDGEAPSIDFAGAGRTVPWATWYENTSGTGFNTDNVFASRFDNTGDANQGKWIFAGQSRGTGGPDARLRPSTSTPIRRREPVGGGRLGRRSDQAGSVGHLAGDRPPRRSTARIRSSSSGRSGPAPRTATASSLPVSSSPGTCRRSAASAGSRSASRASARPRPIRASTSTRPVTGSSRTSPSPVRTTAVPVGRLVRDGQRRASAACTTTRWCSPPRASATGRQPTAASTGSRSATNLQGHARHDGDPRVRNLRGIGDQRG